MSMGDFRYDDHIRRIIRDFQRSSVARQIQELQKSPVTAELRRSMAKLHETVVPRIPELKRLVNSINSKQTQMILGGVAEFVKAARELRERAFPPNWSEFDEDEIESIVALMEQTGWSLVRVPRGEVVRKLLDAPENAREEVLVNSAAEIVDDLDTAISEVRHSQLVELRDKVVQAIGAFRAGLHGPAQSYATAVFTTTMHVHLGLKRFRAARDEFAKRDPMEVEIMLFKLAAIYRAAGRAIDIYMGEDDEPILPGKRDGSLLAARGLLRPLGLRWRLRPGLRKRLRPLLSRHVWLLPVDVLPLRH